MKSSQLVAILRQLADLVETLPESELASVSKALQGLLTNKGKTLGVQRRGGNLFSVIDLLPKRELAELIQAISVPLNVRGKDSQQDVASKVKTLLKKEPDYQRRVRNYLRHGRPTHGSPELESAFRSILRESDETSRTSN